MDRLTFPDIPDWRTQTTFGTSRQPLQQGGSFGGVQFSPVDFKRGMQGAQSYQSLLPPRVQAGRMELATDPNDFLTSMMGAKSVNDVVNMFGSSSVGKVASLKGFGQFDAGADAEIQKAAEKYGVPANFLKTIVAQESSGDWNSNNRVSNIRPAMGGLLPYVGVFKTAADSRGLGHLWQPGNRAAQLELLAGVLRSQYDQLRKTNPNYNWLNVASYHFSGKPVPDGWSDELGQSNSTYMATTEKYWKQLDGASGQAWNPFTSASSQPKNVAGATGSGLKSVFGGTVPRVSQEMGLTEFAKGHIYEGGMYDYATQYGVTGHAGVDYSMNTGSKLYTPVGGTVIRAGGGVYYTDERYGSRAGTGELRIKLDNGDEIILGHMQSINVPVGARVAAGQFVGLSGTSNGGHVHLEYRQWAPGSTPSNYKAIDPDTALRGGFVSPAVGGAATGAVKSSYFTLPGARPVTGSIKNAFRVAA